LQRVDAMQAIAADRVVGRGMSPAMRSVESESLAMVGYDPKRRELHVRFRSSPPRLYIYTGVPLQVFEGLERAGSKGAFVNQVIKPHYPVR